MITQIRAHFCTWFWFKTPKNYKKTPKYFTGESKSPKKRQNIFLNRDNDAEAWQKSQKVNGEDANRRKKPFPKKNSPPAVPLVPHGSKWRVKSRRRPHGTPYECRGDPPTSTLQQDAISRTFFFCSYTIQTHTGIGCNNFIFLTFSVLLSTRTPRATQVHSWCGKRYIRNFHP